MAYFISTTKPAITEEIVAGSRERISQLEAACGQTGKEMADNAVYIKDASFDDDFVHPALQQSARAHRARLKRHIHAAALQPPVAFFFAGAANGNGGRTFYARGAEAGPQSLRAGGIPDRVRDGLVVLMK